MTDAVEMTGTTDDPSGTGDGLPIQNGHGIAGPEVEVVRRSATATGSAIVTYIADRAVIGGGAETSIPHDGEAQG
jgi:hypothetical protein